VRPRRERRPSRAARRALSRQRTALRLGQQVIVFNGRGEERLATVATLDRRRAELNLHEHLSALPEPELDITLVQALVKSDPMDLIVQKATELGVRRICAVKTAFGVVRLDAARAAQRVAHWQGITRSACEQCGRHSPPVIETFDSLARCFATLPNDALRIAWDPRAGGARRALPEVVAKICLLVGPEGGFSAAELEEVSTAGFIVLRLGPRTLRAETAAIAACTFAQIHWGDLRSPQA
jgi:16S rRNA (uracil1498-N3)-methyltransferase